MCGEKQAAVALPQPVLGSPPRMRGKACLTLIIRLLLGITPAHAGKSLPAVLKCPPTRDHPRVCGEKRRVRSWRALLLGSPPRMRGKVICGHHLAHNPGITPAYAGKSSAHNAASVIRKDHPRVCGEKSTTSEDAGSLPGSPPRMRGKGSRMTRATSMVGITPACAGKSARRQAGPPGPAPPPQMRLGWSPPPCTGRQCRTRKNTHARRARIPAPAHTPAPQ